MCHHDHVSLTERCEIAGKTPETDPATFSLPTLRAAQGLPPHACSRNLVEYPWWVSLTMYGACGGEDAATEFRYSLGLDTTKVQTVALEYLYFARYAQEGEQSSEWL